MGCSGTDQTLRAIFFHVLLFGVDTGRLHLIVLTLVVGEIEFLLKQDDPNPRTRTEPGLANQIEPEEMLS